mmetsp:Transcript_24543/g.72968  ORF Transcript_24543/g.72968 Transcript_24543/m.72968 type:complete len:316 (+) Transcript_24543:510-1457(+)
MRDEHPHHRPVRGEVLLQLPGGLEAQLVHAAHYEKAVRILIGEQLQAGRQGLDPTPRAPRGSPALQRLVAPGLGAGVTQGPEHALGDVAPGEGRGPQVARREGQLVVHGASWRRRTRGAGEGGQDRRGGRVRSAAAAAVRRSPQLMQLAEQGLLLLADLRSHQLRGEEVRHGVAAGGAVTRDNALQRLCLLDIPNGAIEDRERLVETLGVEVGGRREDRVDPLPRGLERCGVAGRVVLTTGVRGRGGHGEGFPRDLDLRGHHRVLEARGRTRLGRRRRRHVAGSGSLLAAAPGAATGDGEDPCGSGGAERGEGAR